MSHNSTQNTLLLVIFAIMVAIGILYLWWLAKKILARATKTPKIPLSSIINDKALVYIWLSSMNKNSRINSDSFSFGHVSMELWKYDDEKQTHSPGSYSKNTYISFGPEKYPLLLENTIKGVRSKTVDNYRDDLKVEERSPELTFYFHSLHVDGMISKIEEIRKKNLKYGLLGNITFGSEKDTAAKTIASWIKRVLFLVAVYVNGWLMLIPVIHKICFRVLPSSKPESCSCVSVVFDIFHAGSGISRLLGLSDELLVASLTSKEASKASLESSKEKEIKKCLSRVFSSFGYLIEATLSQIIISPDIFAEFMKKAKCNEITSYGIPSGRKTFKEENVTMEHGQQNFETEEWLPEPRNIERGIISFAFPIILIACMAILWLNIF